MISPVSTFNLICRTQCAIGGLLLLGLTGLGCSADSPASTQPSLTERQQKALNDPMGYTPANHDPKAAEEAAKNKNERSNTLKGDWDRLWNP